MGDDYLTNNKWLFEAFFLYIFENAMLNVYFSAEMLLQLVCELLCDFFVYNVYKSV